VQSKGPSTLLRTAEWSILTSHTERAFGESNVLSTCLKGISLSGEALREDGGKQYLYALLAESNK